MDANGQFDGHESAHDGVSVMAIRAELERILSHPEFQATDKMRDFLRFIVEETLAGRAHLLKGFTIATEVYGRGADFDPAHDPVVRIQAGRLRRAMERYYLVAGGADTVYIEIPKGTYVPTFSPGPPAGRGAGKTTAIEHVPADSWPTILVRPFEVISQMPDLDHLGDGLAVELALELGHYQDIRVLIPRGNRPAKLDARFEVRGHIRNDATRAKVVVQLADNSTDQQVWVESFDFSLDTDELIRFQEEAAASICAHLDSYHGIVPQIMSREALNHPPSMPTSYQALLKAYAYDLALTPESYSAAMEALRIAVAADPECGLLHGALAHLYADNISMEYFDPAETPLHDALQMAQAAVRMEPNSPINRLAMARLNMLDRKIDLAVVEIEAALELNTGSLYYMDVIGMWLAILGEWERGIALVEKAMHLNPFYRAYVHFATWLNHFRLNDYEKAYAETDFLLGSGDFWDPLARATTLARLDRIDEGRAAVENLLALKPNFVERGRVLIRNGIVDDALADRVIVGLGAVGLDIE